MLTVELTYKFTNGMKILHLNYWTYAHLDV